MAKTKADAKPAQGYTRLYPTHRTGTGPLRVSLPSDGVNSPDELEITDEGTEVPDEIAAHLLASRDATETEPD